MLRAISVSRIPRPAARCSIGQLGEQVIPDFEASAG